VGWVLIHPRNIPIGGQKALQEYRGSSLGTILLESIHYHGLPAYFNGESLILALQRKWVTVRRPLAQRTPIKSKRKTIHRWPTGSSSLAKRITPGVW